MIKHKQALYEIFEAAMATGQSLDGVCDKILKTHITKLPSNVDTFICLSTFMVSPVITGRLKEKYSVFRQTIICGGVMYERKIEDEVNAETNGYELLKVVRTILKNNQSLACTSYPSGVAQKMYLSEAPQEFVLYYDTPVCVYSLSVELHIDEDD